MISQNEHTTDATSSVVLPLYSTKAGVKYLPERSGLNQWLASGRLRRFGECYFPVPIEVHKLAEGFFPAQGDLFKLTLPGDLSSRAKLCQAGAKALMTSPNHHLGMWLYKLIDSTPGSQATRMVTRQPFVFQDLENLGFDSVKISKCHDGYVMEPLHMGSYELWVNSLKVASKG